MDGNGWEWMGMDGNGWDGICWSVKMIKEIKDWVK